jgi:ethanolamine ammonia-lyase large subunit
MSYKQTIKEKTYQFKDLKDLMAKASPFRTGDALAGLCAETYEERVAAQIRLADVPLKVFISDVIVPYEKDEITRLIIDEHNLYKFAVISHLTVGEFRDWLLKEPIRLY